MKYALERMDHLIRIVLQPAVAGDIDPVRAEQWIEMTVQEKENVVAYLVHKALTVGRSQEFAVVVRHYQNMVSQLMDFVHAQRNRGASAAFKQFIRKVLDHLEELLLQIKERYHEYFDREAKVPEPHLLKVLQRLKKNWSGVQKKWEGKIADAALAQIVFGEAMSLLEGDRVWRYCDLSYAKHFVQALDRFELHQKGSGDDALWHLLVHLNFNTEPFIFYLTQKIEQDTKDLSSQSRAKRLAFWMKQINQQSNGTQVCAHPHCASVKEQLNNWLSQEIYWAEQEMPAGTDGMRPSTVVGDLRLHFGVSVEVLTLLARAAKESGLIVNDHLTEVFKVLSQTCRTTYQEKPSAHSMLKKSYVAERGAKEAAIDWLHQIIKVIHRY